MKKFNCTTEGHWLVINFEAVPSDLTERLMETGLSKDERLSTIAEIKALRESPASQAESLALNEIYESVKPNLEEGQTYSLISIDAHQVEDLYTGIINCRVNEEHVQVRF